MSIKKIIPFFIPHVGCPYICVFCNQRRITGVQKIPTPAEIEENIKEYTKEYSKKYSKEHTVTNENAQNWEVAFYGGSFSAIPRELQESLLVPAKKALDEGLIDSIRCSTRPDAVENDELDFLQSFGLTTIELGVQSFDDEILTNSKRGHTEAQVIAGADRIKEHGMTLGIQLMPGLPGETWHSLVRTAVHTTNIKPAMARVYPVLVIKDTELATMYEKGLYEPLSVEKAVVYSAFLKEWLEQHKVNVIRTGLQSTEDFDRGEGIVAGPYEPAMGERVVSRQWQWRIERALLDHHENFEVTVKQKLPMITVSYPRRLTSKIGGVGQENKKYFQKNYPMYNWKWLEDKQHDYVTLELPSEMGRIKYTL